MWRMIAAAACLALLAAGCAGGTTESPEDPTTARSATPDEGADGGDAGTDDDLGGDLKGAAAETVPGCPFTAAQVSDFVGQPMKDEGNCLFGDGKGVGSVTITMGSQTSGAMTYGYARKQAGEIYEQVVDGDWGDQSYIGVKDIEGQAVVVSKTGSYTVTLSSLSFDPARYERTLRSILDALPR
ncbi:hypothetical protein [Actinopolymorpha alba]|uniref:hypothetical protein n=1 Tax=Actinopolymorpha alba TaxID=533267 RepID=UPI000362A18F|nr:hypothetical protein [Actinopolymorpha alba]